MTEAMLFLQKNDITFLRPPTIMARFFFLLLYYLKKGVTEYLGSLIDINNFN